MPVDAKTKYKAKKTKIVFFDIDDTLRVKKTGYIPESVKAVFKGLKEKEFDRNCQDVATSSVVTGHSRPRARLFCNHQWNLCD